MPWLLLLLLLLLSTHFLVPISQTDGGHATFCFGQELISSFIATSLKLFHHPLCSKGLVSTRGVQQRPRPPLRNVHVRCVMIMSLDHWTD